MDGEIIKRFYPQPGPNPLAWETTWMFVQPELEAVLRRGVARFANVEVLLSHAFVDVTVLDFTYSKKLNSRNERRACLRRWSALKIGFTPQSINRRSAIS